MIRHADIYFSTVSSLHQASPLPGHEKPIRFPGRLVSVDVVDNVQVNLSFLSHTSMDFLAGEWWGTNAHAMCSLTRSLSGFGTATTATTHSLNQSLSVFM